MIFALQSNFLHHITAQTMQTMKAMTRLIAKAVLVNILKAGFKLHTLLSLFEIEANRLSRLISFQNFVCLRGIGHKGKLEFVRNMFFIFLNFLLFK